MTETKEFKGTKGKWEVSKSGNSRFLQCVTAEDGGSVCFITNWSEHNANAKLIAASPELLKFAIKAIEFIQANPLLSDSPLARQGIESINKAT